MGKMTKYLSTLTQVLLFLRISVALYFLLWMARWPSDQSFHVYLPAGPYLVSVHFTVFETRHLGGTPIELP